MHVSSCPGTNGSWVMNRTSDESPPHDGGKVSEASTVSVPPAARVCEPSSAGVAPASQPRVSVMRQANGVSKLPWLESEKCSVVVVCGWMATSPGQTPTDLNRDASTKMSGSPILASPNAVYTTSPDAAISL